MSRPEFTILILAMLASGFFAGLIAGLFVGGML